jgi:hypothetical protein
MYGGVYAVHSASDQVRNLDKQYPAIQKMSNKFFMPKKGDKVRVRLFGGEAILADYVEYNNPESKIHIVDTRGRLSILVCIKGRPSNVHQCRFIGPSADMVPV